MTPIIQTIAIFRDAYREMNAKKLFWFVLAISGFVVAVFAMVGVYEDGLSINMIFKEWRFPSVFNTQVMSPESFYKLVFVQLGIHFWLAWAATGLALISTAGIFPSFLASGSIELTLSKPIGRVRLFLTKYVSGLLFVALQVLVFSGAAFLVIGFRGESWEPRIFLAVPIVLAFFSYLFGVCALFGLLTRSTIASLLLTLLVWFGFWSVGTAENLLLVFDTRAQTQVEAIETEIASREETIRAIESDDQQGGFTQALAGRMTLEERRRRLEGRREDLERELRTARSIARWQDGLYTVKTVLPKTGETIGLLDRYLLPPEEMARFRDQQQSEQERARAPNQSAMVQGEDVSTDQRQARNVEIDDRMVAERTEQAIRERPLGWVLGTSLAFEAVILALGCFIFARRDF